jgi:hypothetical protein
MTLLTILLQADANAVTDIFNIGIMDIIREWKNTYAVTYSTKLVEMARLMCGFFAIIWCGVKLYPVIAGEDKLSVLPILRPFVIALLLTQWPHFVDLCMIPGNAVESVGKEEFDSSWTKMRENSKLRFQLRDEHQKLAFQMSVFADRAEDSERNQLMQSGDIGKEISGGPFGLGAAVASMAMVVINGIKQFYFGIISYLSILFMNVVVCGVLLAQTAGLLIMSIVGPLAFAFSCLDPWRHSWSQWVARFISISLWSGFAYFVCFVGTEIMNAGLEAEIEVLQESLKMEKWEFAMVTSLYSSDNVLFSLLCLFIAFGMLVIFPVSTWVVQTAGGAAVLQPIGAAVGVAATAAGIAMGGGGAAAGSKARGSIGRSV